jgi:HAD superfamily hydrolase (TIGR01509 family)
MSIGAFIFDMDGTLVDNMPYHTRSWLKMFAGLGVEMTPVRLDRLMGSRTTPELLRHVLGEHLSEAEIQALSLRKEAIYRAEYGPHLEPVQGVLRFLQDARRLNLSMAVATSAGRRNIEFILGGLGVKTYFDVVVGGDEVLQGKSGPEIYLVTAQKLGMRPEQCLVFEDSRSGIQAARLAGMRIIVVATNPRAEEFRSLPSVIEVVGDFERLAPEELLHLTGTIAG